MADDPFRCNCNAGQYWPAYVSAPKSIEELIAEYDPEDIDKAILYLGHERPTNNPMVLIKILSILKHRSWARPEE